MYNKKEIKRRKFCIIFKNGSKFILSADYIELDYKCARDDCLRLFKMKNKDVFSEIAVFNFENIAGWYEVAYPQQNNDGEDNE